MKPSMVLVWGSSGPSQGHRQHLVMGQPHAIISNALGQYIPIGITSPERHWANLKPSMVPVRDSSGPSQGHRHYLVMGQPHAIGSNTFGQLIHIYQHHLSRKTLGQLEAIDDPSSGQLWVISRSSAASSGRPPHAIGSNAFSQFIPIGITCPDRHWANLKPSMVMLRDSSGPCQVHRQHLVMGPPHATSSKCFGQIHIHRISPDRYWANLKPSMMVVQVSSGPCQVHRQHLVMG
jgi:hypothetical protein